MTRRRLIMIEFSALTWPLLPSLKALVWFGLEVTTVSLTSVR